MALYTTILLWKGSMVWFRSVCTDPPWHCPPCVIPAYRTWRTGCCSVSGVLWSPAVTPGKCWVWQPVLGLGPPRKRFLPGPPPGPPPSPGHPCGGGWRQFPAATAAPPSAWALPLGWVPWEVAFSGCGFSVVPDRSDPWLLLFPLLLFLQ